MLINTLGFLANFTSLILWLPQARMTLKNKNNSHRIKLVKKEKENGLIMINRWFTFSAYKQLSDKEKITCLDMIYNTDFGKQVNKEILNGESYEQMNFLDKMYWDKEFWVENKDNFDRNVIIDGKIRT